MQTANYQDNLSFLKNEPYDFIYKFSECNTLIADYNGRGIPKMKDVFNDMIVKNKGKIPSLPNFIGKCLLSPKFKPEQIISAVVKKYRMLPDLDDVQTAVTNRFGLAYQSLVASYLAQQFFDEKFGVCNDNDGISSFEFIKNGLLFKVNLFCKDYKKDLFIFSNKQLKKEANRLYLSRDLTDDELIVGNILLFNENDLEDLFINPQDHLIFHQE